MKSHTKHLTFNVPSRMEFVNITSQVEDELRASGISEGLCLVNAMHITASVFINDDEPGLHEDYKKWLEELAPFDASPQRYRHNRTGEANADPHHKRQIMGREVVVAITDGPWKLILSRDDARHPPIALFDLEQDPDETWNLMAVSPVSQESWENYLRLRSRIRALRASEN